MAMYYIQPPEAVRNIFANCVPISVVTRYLKEDSQPQTHSFAHMIIVTGGSANLVINGNSIPIKEGDACVVPENAIHYYSHVCNIEFITSSFFKQNLLKCAGSLKEIPAFRNLFIMQPFLLDNHKWSNMLILDYEGLHYCKTIVDYCMDEITHPDICIDVMLESYFMLLVAFLTRTYENESKNKFVPQNSKTLGLKRLATYIEKNYAKEVSVRELAEIMHLSVRQFHRVFVEYFQCTPLQYLLRVRINHACHYLKYTDIQVSEIVTRCGFNDGNYFSKKFKEIVGVFPKAYRADNRAQIQKAIAES